MPAELCLDRIGNAAGLHCRNGSFKFGNHGTGPEPTQRTATGARGACGFFAGGGCEICTAFQLFYDGFGFIFGFDKNVAGVEFLGRFGVGIGRVIGGLQRFVGHGCGQNLFDRFACNQRATLVFHRQFNTFGQIARKTLFQRGLLDQLVENARKQHFVGKLLVLLGQCRLCNQHVAKCDFDAIHSGNNGGHLGRFILRVQRLGQSKSYRNGGKNS